jgi:3-oxoacyl-[acyl-carrier protein] reductase
MILKDKVALITGGSRGIGRAIALDMAKNGANIAVIYAGRQDAAEEVVTCAEEYGVNARSYQCDVSDFGQAKQTIDAVINDFGGIDILVNNAGVTADKLIMAMKEEDFDGVISVNLKGAFNMIKHVCPHFIKKRSGTIINITSVSGIAGNAGQANYSSAKAGIIGLTKTVAKELASRNVTCNAIAPGFIDTDMTKQMPQNIIEAAVEHIPLKKMGQPQDVSALAVFLASDMARYITGEVIKVDGGLCI